MKRIISSILAVLMVIGTVAALGMTASATAVKYAEPAKKGAAVEVNAYTANRVIDGNNSADIAISGGKITITRKPETLGSNTGVEVDFDAVDATGKQFMQFWLDMSESSVKSSTGIGFRIFATDGSAGDIYASNNAVNYYIQINKKWVKYTVKNNLCTIPAGYAGYVRIDLDQFGDIIPSYCGNGSKLSDNLIYHYNLWFSPNAEQVGKPIIVSDVKFVSGGASNLYSHKQADQPKIIGEAVEYGDYTDFAAMNGNCDVAFKGDKVSITRKAGVNNETSGVELYANEIDATGKQFIELWIDTIDASKVNGVSCGIRIFAKDDVTPPFSAADIYFANGTEFFYLVNNNWVRDVIAGNSFTLPAGFAGYVRIDLNQLKENISAYTGNGKQLDPSRIWGIWLWFGASAEHDGNAINVNSIRFVNATNAPETSDNMTAGIAVACVAAVCGIVFVSKKRKK